MKPAVPFLSFAIVRTVDCPLEIVWSRHHQVTQKRFWFKFVWCERGGVLEEIWVTVDSQKKIQARTGPYKGPGVPGSPTW